MKLISKITVAALAMMAVGQASAASTTIINITGSTAFRTAVNTALLQQFNGKTNWGYLYTGTSQTGSSKALYKGELSAGNLYIIRTSFNGSGTGIQKLVTNATDINFIDSAATTATTDAGAKSYAGATVNTNARVSLSDVYQGSTAFKSPALLEATVDGFPIAVAGFKFFTNFGQPSLNITPQNFAALAANPGLPLNFFNGLGSSTPVYLVGRDNGSGTRITVLAETGYGVNNPVIQYYGSAETGTAKAADYAHTAIAFVPTSGGISTLTLDPSLGGNGGYTSGGDVAIALGADTTSVSVDGGAPGPVALLGYMGSGDAASAATFGRAPVLCTYNGVAYSDAAIQSGQYTLWGYEHLYTKTGLTTAESTWLTDFKIKLEANLGAAGLTYGSMSCARSEDGGVVGP